MSGNPEAALVGVKRAAPGRRIDGVLQLRFNRAGVVWRFR
jgi:hypothetical protein